MLTGLSTWTMPLVDSHVDRERGRSTLDAAASPIDISCHSAGRAAADAEQGRAERRAGLVGVRAERRRRPSARSPSRSTTTVDDVAGLDAARTASPSSSEPSTATPSTLRMTSPASSPALGRRTARPATRRPRRPARSTSSPRMAYTREQQHDGDQQVHQRAGGDDEHPARDSSAGGTCGPRRRAAPRRGCSCR